jgi:hypothetical protein
MIHSWDQQFVRLHHRVAQLEEQNEELRHSLRDAQRIFDLTPAVRRPPAAPSRIAKMLRVFLHHSASDTGADGRDAEDAELHDG